MLDFMASLGPRMVDTGIHIVPIAPQDKFPATFGFGCWRPMYQWTRYASRLPTDLELFHWTKRPDAGIGIVCGSIAAIDIDFTNSEKALEVDHLARKNLGDTPALRIGQSPKRLLVYRADWPIKSLSLGPLELLGVGRQFVGYGIHPATGKPYFWPEEGLADLNLKDLPIISTKGLSAFLAVIQRRFHEDLISLEVNGNPDKNEAMIGRPRFPNPDRRGTLSAIRAALEHIPNDDLPYDQWVRLGMAIKGALGDESWLLFADWSSRSKKNEPSFTAKTWQSLRPNRIGAGTIYHTAIKAGWQPASDVHFSTFSVGNNPASKLFKVF